MKKFDINEWHKKNVTIIEMPGLPVVTQHIHRALKCVDGFAMSVQASDGHFCDPRLNKAWPYGEFEIGFPTKREPLLMEFAEERNKPTKTIYPYVPATLINTIVEKHGGIAE